MSGRSDDGIEFVGIVCWSLSRYLQVHFPVPTKKTSLTSLSFDLKPHRTGHCHCRPCPIPPPLN